MKITQGWNGKMWLEHGGVTHFAGSVILAIFPKFGIVQLGAGEKWTKPKALAPGEQESWVTGSYKITIERLTSDDKILSMPEAMARREIVKMT